MRRGENRYPIRRQDDMGLSPWEQSWLTPSSFLGGSPWQMMRRMQEDMDQLFSTIFGEGSGGTGLASTGASGSMGSAGAMATAGGGGGAAGRAIFAPSLDISENRQEWCIEAELPGVDRDDIQVEIQHGHLRLSAEMRQETEEGPEEGRRYHRRERRVGYFERLIPLPENVDEEGVRCEFRNGILAIHLPKRETQQPQARRIPIVDAGRIPSETGAGRERAGTEMAMTSGGEGGAGTRQTAGGAQGMAGETGGGPGTAGAHGMRGGGIRDEMAIGTDEESPAAAGAKGGEVSARGRSGGEQEAAAEGGTSGAKRRSGTRRKKSE